MEIDKKKPNNCSEKSRPNPNMLIVPKLDKGTVTTNSPAGWKT